MSNSSDLITQKNTERNDANSCSPAVKNASDRHRAKIPLVRKQRLAAMNGNLKKEEKSSSFRYVPL